MTATPSPVLAFIARNEAFYRNYQWTLDPVPSLRELLQRLKEEMDRYDSWSGWEAQESRINLYLFCCAIACTVDDHLAARPWNLAGLAKRIPATGAMEAVLNSPHELKARIENRKLIPWRRDWGGSVDAVCRLLRSGQDRGFFAGARRLLSTATAVLPEAALQRRMRIPEAFRCQDLTHYDVYATIDLCLPAFEDRTRPIAVVGSRSAGAYIAPLAATYLRELGYQGVEWLTVRPKSGFTGGERRWLRTQIGTGAALLLVDDHQNTGHTQRTMLTALRGLGAKSSDLVVAVPGHPVSPHWTLPEEIERGVRIFVLPPESRYKVKLLEQLDGSPCVALNQKFEAEYPDGFQVRVKRVFDVEMDGTRRRVMAKSTGWGWLGYHAWIAGGALEGFVPPALGFSEGVLYSEWLDGQPMGTPDLSRIGEYVARRVEVLPLAHDPVLDSPGYRWCGWDELVALLRQVYGPMARLHTGAIRRRLRQDFTPPHPTLVDGRMRPCEWIRAGSAWYKTDYEQHNFGGGELDLSDPAWDLAAAVFEFDLSPDAERELMEGYSRHTADPSLAGRLLLHKLLYSAVAMRGAKYWMHRDAVLCDGRYIAARDFATFHLARYCGRTITTPARWTDRLFFLDLDGVLNWVHLGIPHTTPSGVQALQHLADAGYSVVLNTLRNIHHVREFSSAYRLPGGVGEMGSVFWDAVEGIERPLVEPETLDQLARVHDELQRLPGVLFDTGYRYSIYTYRYKSGERHGLTAEEVEGALRNAGADRCGYVLKGSGTHIIQKDRSKAASLPQVRRYLNCADQPIAAIDDADAGLLKAAGFAYTPANAASEVRGIGKRMPGRWQKGLLQAAVDLTGKPAAAGRAPESLIDALLSVPDRGILSPGTWAIR